MGSKPKIPKPPPSYVGVNPDSGQVVYRGNDGLAYTNYGNGLARNPENDFFAADPLFFSRREEEAALEEQQRQFEEQLAAIEAETLSAEELRQDQEDRRKASELAQSVGAQNIRRRARQSGRSGLKNPGNIGLSLDEDEGTGLAT